jgi:DNA-binding NarL/FixJ family response regulator
MAETLRVAIVDPYPIFRDGVVQALRKEKNIGVVAEGTTAQDAEKFAATKKIHVLLFEAAVPGSLRAAQAILSANPAIKVIFLASAEDDGHVVEALRAGVCGYIMKGITGLDLIKAIKAVHRGERFITPDLAWRLASTPASVIGRKAQSEEPLTVREQQVLDQSSKGLTNQEIAKVLGLSVSTIKYYKTQVFKKVGARNRVEALFAMNRVSKQS